MVFNTLFFFHENNDIVLQNTLFHTNNVSKAQTGVYFCGFQAENILVLFLNAM